MAAIQGAIHMRSARISAAVTASTCRRALSHTDSSGNRIRTLHVHISTVHIYILFQNASQDKSKQTRQNVNDNFKNQGEPTFDGFKNQGQPTFGTAFEDHPTIPTHRSRASVIFFIRWEGKLLNPNLNNNHRASGSPHFHTRKIATEKYSYRGQK